MTAHFVTDDETTDPRGIWAKRLTCLKRKNQRRQRLHFLWFSSNFQLGVASDVILSMSVEDLGIDVCVEVGDSRQNRSRVM